MMKRYLKWNKLKQVFGLFQWTNTIFVDWKVHLQFSPDGNGILNIKFLLKNSINMIASAVSQDRFCH